VTTDLIARLEDLCGETAEAVSGHPDLALEVSAIRARLRSPLRLAIAGRAKAGKSTLLNALIGERVAATDAGECTIVVTWYVHGHSYGASAVTKDGCEHDLRLRVDEEGRTRIDLGDLAADDIDRITVTWPAAVLSDLVLIDTPGLGSINDDVSRRTQAFLTPDHGHGDADAVVYLMRHMHRRDVDFFEAFADSSLAACSPANSVAMLSRADEIGAARPDALDSARRIALRLQGDGELKRLCSDVLPLAGLLAETGSTLREEEVGWLRAIAAEQIEQLEPMLHSVERFLRATTTSVAPEFRAELIDRLGLYGVRQCVELLRARSVSTASELSRRLIDLSGVTELQTLIRTRFLRQANVLKSRSALCALREVAHHLIERDGETGAVLDARLDQFTSGASELESLRALTLVTAGLTKLHEEAEREALAALDRGVQPGMGRVELVERVDRWRSLAQDPLHDPATAEVCNAVARVYEQAFVGADS
jgi:50S ribosome-binding GTPase